VPGLQARVNILRKEVRCGLPDCSALLLTGEIIHASIRIKCKCGVVNEIIAVPKNGRHIPEGLALKSKSAKRHTSKAD
jgi:hypothetical protein